MKDSVILHKPGERMAEFSAVRSKHSYIKLSN